MTDNNMSQHVRQIIVGHANTIHDPAIAIVEGDKIFAEGIERHIQCKRAIENTRLWYSTRPIRKALSDLGMFPVKDAQVVSISSWDIDLLRKIENERLKGESTFEEESLMACSLVFENKFVNQLNWIFHSNHPYVDEQPHDLVPDLIKDELNISVKSKMLKHHLAHAANAVYTSTFEECVVMIIDAYGEGTTTSFYHFKDNDFKLINEQIGQSLGHMYAFYTDLCGFNSLEGEEWKIMGLAAYGKYREDIYNFFAKRIIIDGLNVQINILPHELFSELKPMVGEFHKPYSPDVMMVADFAHNFQKCFEEVIIKLVKNVDSLGLSENLAYSGGCALNSSVNGKIIENSNFKRLHVPSAPADDGNCIGSTLYEKYYIRKEKRKLEIMSPFLGSMVDIKKLEKILDFKGIKFEKASDENELCSKTAKILSDGNIIGWMQGRAEFGPRALGNRSILADPRNPNMKDKINSKVKFREEYRPLAPSILHEFGEAYFENYQEIPYMERALRFRKEVRDKIPAVVHLDGTGRLQSVKKEYNCLYYQLIYEFYKITDIPILLNTSLNVMGKPIVNSVEDAITVFYTTGMDYLIIGNYILLKK